MSTEQHGEARDYDGMQAILRRVADLRNISRESIDELAGLPRGFAAKALGEVPLRRLGFQTLASLVGALGVKFIVVDDLEAMAKYTARMEGRNESQVRMLTADKHEIVTFKITKRRLKKLAKLATKARKRIPARKRSAIARKAAKARWRTPKVVEIKADAAAVIAKTSQEPCAAPSAS